MSDHTLQEQLESLHTTLECQPVLNSDFYIRTLFEPGLVDTQYNVSNFLM